MYNLGQSRFKSLFHTEAQRAWRKKFSQILRRFTQMETSSVSIREICEMISLRSPFLCVKFILSSMVYHYLNQLTSLSKKGR
jgi:hypothetical protein